MSTAKVERLPDGSLRVTCKAHSPAAVFIDSSPDQGGLWARGYPQSPDAADRAAEEFVATAVRAVTAVDGVPNGTVAVIGEGLLARLVERLLPASFGSEHPQAVIEATGSKSNVKRAIRSVDALGTVVLAAPITARVVPVASYADIHLRSRTVIGLPWSVDPPDAPATLVDWALDCLANTGDGECPPPAPWYRFDT
jgi:threonine dehydrogenase-like Zn-dependent dehydrogenase